MNTLMAADVRDRAGSLPVALEAQRRLRGGDAFWFAVARVEGSLGPGREAELQRATLALLARAAAFCSFRAHFLARVGDGGFVLLTERRLDEDQLRRRFRELAGRLGSGAELRVGQVCCAPGAFADVAEVSAAANSASRRPPRRENMEETLTTHKDRRLVFVLLALAVLAALASACAGRGLSG